MDALFHIRPCTDYHSEIIFFFRSSYKNLLLSLTSIQGKIILGSIVYKLFSTGYSFNFPNEFISTLVFSQYIKEFRHLCGKKTFTDNESPKILHQIVCCCHQNYSKTKLL